MPPTPFILAAALVVVFSWETIPSLVEAPGIFSSYTAAYRFPDEGPELVFRGYKRNREGVFRIPRLFRWDYVANGTQRIKEVVAAPDDVLSLQKGVNETLQVPFLMGREIAEHPYHHEAIRNALTRSLGRVLPEVMDEIVAAYDDVFASVGDDWKNIILLPNIMRVVARASNRLFVGLPLCRNQEYLRISIAYTVSVFKRGRILGKFPRWLRPLIAPLMSPKPQAQREAMKFLGPVIEERFAKERELGPEWADRPSDLITWLMDSAGPQKTVSDIAWRVVICNMAAIHTTTMALVNALLDLAAHPSHIEPMREEVERVFRQEGWTKAALSNMHRVDSFLRESQRVNGGSAVSMNREVVSKDGFKFSDGTFIPSGSFLAVAGRAVQFDPGVYSHPETFDGFRFSRMRDERSHKPTNEGIFKSHLVSTTTDYVVFGHGKHACPGRFFAATELKGMLAHILMTYDVEVDAHWQEELDYASGQARSLARNPMAGVRFRRRKH
ncbi:cytochrome P450 [Mycena filopes]|nr:cytochrome P450 [Mycena filopes]